MGQCLCASYKQVFMKNSLPSFFLFFVLVFLSCSPTNRKTQAANDSKQESKGDVYTSIQKIAEALPMTEQEAIDFFNNLDSLKQKSFRNTQGQQFQYKAYTVFYAQPRKGKTLKGVGIDLDSTSHLLMDQLADRMNAKWHSADLIEVQAGKIHYTADYLDSKKIR